MNAFANIAPAVFQAPPSQYARRLEVLERVTMIGGGAFRSTRTIEPLGLVRAPWTRFALAAIVALTAAATLLVLLPK